MGPKKKSKTKLGPTRDRRGWLERRAFELSKLCPVEHGNPLDCPLFELRPLRARERKVWIHRLSDEELEYLATYHACCATVKAALAAE